jgi:hypothetical protein
MKSQVKDLVERFKENEDYEYVGITEEPGWAIHLLTGDYEDVIIHYTNIKVQPVEEAEEDELTLSFEYNILNPTVVPANVKEYKMSQYFGDVLMSAISTGLKNGTAILDERESQQDYPTISFDE